MSVQQALEDLYSALGRVEGVRPHRGLGVVISPPASVVSLPTLERGSRSTEPTNATFTVALIVAVSERAGEELLRLEQLVVDEIDTLPNVSVGTSAPGSWPVSGVDLPAYLIPVEVAV